jgi:RNA polymerase sigma factor (sigma-70 family)
VSVQQSDRLEAVGSNPNLERVRLVRLCHAWTRDRHAAEDLTQETLAEAWIHQHALRDSTRRWSWLAGIAHNRFLHWRRRQARDFERTALVGNRADGDEIDPIDTIADHVNLDDELEQSELADLIERALAVLPASTRSVLIERYVEERPQSEVARRQGVSEGSVEARLHRGKQALRRVLATDLRAEAASFGLVPSPNGVVWQETRIWCPLCGRRRLRGRFLEDHTRFILRCEDCLPDEEFNVADSGGMNVIAGVNGYRTALSRLLDSVSRLIPEGSGDNQPRCLSCRRPLNFVVDPSPYGPSWLEGRRHLSTHCVVCGLRNQSLVIGLGLAALDGRRFWREHPRIFALPEREIEAEGQPALVTGFAAVDSTARFHCVFSLASLRLLSTHGGTDG